LTSAARWAIAAVSVASLLALAPAAVATFPGENGKIAFISGRGAPVGDDSNSQVFIFKGLDSPSLTPVTSGAGQFRHPNWAPNLKRIAFSRFISATDRDIWIENLATGAETRLGGLATASVQDDRPSWSPNGKKIAYESEASIASGQQDILITTLKTGLTVNLTSTPNLIEGKPVWSPDGKTIYYSRRSTTMPTEEDILKEPSNNSTTVPSFVVNTATNEYQPALSADGKQMCFTRGGPSGSSNTDIYKVRLNDTSNAIPIFADGGGGVGDYNCAWAPDGKRIIFVHRIFSAGGLETARSDGSQGIHLLTTEDNKHFDGNPDWAPKHPAICDGMTATIAGTDKKDHVKGTKDSDVIVVHRGNDTVDGRGGNDLVCGGSGKDRLRGGSGKDRLLGEGGADTLNGGRGNDKCVGGPGKDVTISC
jgi:Tol biopolymer transport system component